MLSNYFLPIDLRNRRERREIRNCFLWKYCACLQSGVFAVLDDNKLRNLSVKSVASVSCSSWLCFLLQLENALNILFLLIFHQSIYFYHETSTPEKYVGPVQNISLTVVTDLIFIRLEYYVSQVNVWNIFLISLLNIKFWFSLLILKVSVTVCDYPFVKVTFFIVSSDTEIRW